MSPVATVSGDLPDVNVWLALTVLEHPHHQRALRYWQDETAPLVNFCRITMLGLVRLLTQPRVMGSAMLDSGQAMAAYHRWDALPDVNLHPEPPGCEAALARLVTAGLPARLLTDAYLAAFAASAGLRLVSFDADFDRFGIDWLHLRPA